MSRSIRASGVAVGAVFALGAFGAGPALAATHTFDAELANTFVTASPLSSHQVFEAVAGSGETVECTGVSIAHSNKANGEHLVDDGEMVGTFKEAGVYTEEKLNVRFTYTGCEHVTNKGQKTEKRAAASVAFGGCYYAYENVTNELGRASFELHCPSGEKVRITLAGGKNAGRSPTRRSSASATTTQISVAGPAGTSTSQWR